MTEENFYRINTKWLGDKYEATSKTFPGIKAYDSSSQEAISRFRELVKKETEK